MFRLLPEDIQQELLHTHCPPGPSTSNTKETADRPCPSERPTAVNQPAGTSVFPGEDVTAAGRPSSLRSPDCEFPGHVDPRVFSELPPDVQRELMTEWKQQKPVLKTWSRRPAAGRSSGTRDRKAAGRGSQKNDLFKYFKPS